VLRGVTRFPPGRARAVSGSGGLLPQTSGPTYYSPYEILVQATSLNAELLGRAGKRHPYQEGPLGVIKPGAYADIVIVDGNPLEDIALLGDPEKNLEVLMKDGKVYKNTLR